MNMLIAREQKCLEILYVKFDNKISKLCLDLRPHIHRRLKMFNLKMIHVVTINSPHVFVS